MQSAGPRCSSAWLIRNSGGNTEACSPVWKGGVGGKAEERAVEYLDRTEELSPPRILPGGALTRTKSERRRSCPGENDKVTPGIAEIISVKHSDSVQSNDASCSHFRGGNQFLHQVAICFSKCPCRPSPPSIYQFKCCKLIMCHCALYCFRIILILIFSQ